MNYYKAKNNQSRIYALNKDENVKDWIDEDVVKITEKEAKKIIIKIQEENIKEE